MDEEKRVMLQEIAMQPDFVRTMSTSCWRPVARRWRSIRRALSGVGLRDRLRRQLLRRARRPQLHDGCDRHDGGAGRGARVLALSRLLHPDGRVRFRACPTRERSHGPSRGCSLARRARRLDLRGHGQRVNAAREAAETLVKVNATPNIKERPDGTRVVTPGTVTYTASLLGLCVAGIALGERARKARPGAGERAW